MRIKFQSLNKIVRLAIFSTYALGSIALIDCIYSNIKFNKNQSSYYKQRAINDIESAAKLAGIGLFIEWATENEYKRRSYFYHKNKFQ